MLRPEETNILQVDKLGTGFRLQKKIVFSRQEMKMKIIIFNYDVIMMSRTPIRTLALGK